MYVIVKCVWANYGGRLPRWRMEEAILALLHAGGGAVGVWDPAGLRVALGHDALQAGFYGRLWRPAAPPARVGLDSLVRAGYAHVALGTSRGQGVARTFLLLRDPLTPVRVEPLDVLHFPQIGEPTSAPKLSERYRMPPVVRQHLGAIDA